MSQPLPLLSIVVPLYNQEQWLGACLDSIASQPLESMEVLLVDDGSTDRSSEICQSFVERDSRFRLIKRTNGGYGAALNTGLDAARGEWIGIVESDDLVRKDMYPRLLSLASQGDASIVKAGFEEINEKDWRIGIGSASTRPVPSGGSFRPQDYPDLYTNHFSIWSAIYSKSFLDEQEIRCCETQGGYQDAYFAFACYHSNPVIRWTNRPLYRYRRFRQGNSMGQEGNVGAAVLVLSELIGFSKLSPVEIRGILAIMLWHFLRLNPTNWEDYYNQLRELVRLLEDQHREEFRQVLAQSSKDQDRYAFQKALVLGRKDEAFRVIRSLRHWRRRVDRLRGFPGFNLLRRLSRCRFVLHMKSFRH